MKIPDTEVPVEQCSPWISVEDLLPAEDGRYLVAVQSQHVEAKYIRVSFFWPDMDNLWEQDHVTHWMPLPALPVSK